MGTLHRGPIRGRCGRNVFRNAAGIAAASLVLALGLATGPLAGTLVAGEPLVPPRDIPLITIHPPVITLVPLDPLRIVTIPDANLNAALHTACGIPMSDPLRRGDLYALTGTLNLSGKGISNLEGVQYCRQITKLVAAANPLSTLPDLSGMAVLQQLSLVSCRFTSIPETITEIPDLALLSMDDNAITEIPAALASVSTLRVLLLSENEIREVPAAFGSSGLTILSLSANRLTSIPDEVVALSTLKTLYLDLNRLTSLPDAFVGRSFHTLDVQFNFLDVSPGSATRTMLEGLVTATLRYEYQLPPIRGLNAETTADGIAVGWAPCGDRSGPGYTATVTRYLVYRNEGGTLTELAILDPETNGYIDDGLAPGTTRTYTIGVEYRVVTTAFDAVTRNYASLTASTPTEAPTPSPASESTPSPTAGVTAGPTPGEPTRADGPSPSPTPTDPKDGGRTWFAVLAPWLLALGGLIVLAVIGTVVLLVLRRKRRTTGQG